MRFAFLLAEMGPMCFLLTPLPIFRLLHRRPRRDEDVEPGRFFFLTVFFVSYNKILEEGEKDEMAFLRFYRAALAAACGTSNPNRIVVGKRASSTASSSLISNTIDSIDSVNWDDRIGLQSAWSNPEKGWQVDVEWKTTPYGAGLFAKQDMKTF